MLHPGDVFVAKLPDGRFKAVRVIRKIGKSALVSTSEYLGRDRPALDEPLLRKTVLQKRFLYKGVPASTWLDGTPPANFEFLGNIPPSKVEAEMECNLFGGKWHEASGNEAFLEWRWLHDRPAFEAEVRQQQEESKRRDQLPQKPKKMMSEATFWSIIGLLDWKHQAAESKIAIRQFEERLAFLLYQLDTKAHASNIGADSYNPESNYVSADDFLYARCVVVANGREFYKAVLHDPSKMPKDMEFEALLSIASAAYELKTGEDFDYGTGCSYESFSNVAGWKQESKTNG
jgi:hypothetical protein